MPRRAPQATARVPLKRSVVRGRHAKVRDMWRALSCLILGLYTLLGAALLFDGGGVEVTVMGLFLLLTGCAWLTVDALRHALCSN